MRAGNMIAANSRMNPLDSGTATLNTAKQYDDNKGRQHSIANIAFPSTTKRYARPE